MLLFSALRCMRQRMTSLMVRIWLSRKTCEKLQLIRRRHYNAKLTSQALNMERKMAVQEARWVLQGVSFASARKIC